MAPGRPRSLRTFSFAYKRDQSAEPPSPTFSETTNVSAFNFGTDGPSKIITRANLKASLQAYDDLMNSCATYRSTLIAMGEATAAFADAMAACSALKGPSYETGTRLQAAAGLHHLIGNHYYVLSESLDRKFEKPLKQHLDTYRTIVQERSASYERSLREKSRIIRETEMKNMNKKERNLQSFRQALSVLQRQVDELDDLKAQHYQEIIEHEEEVWDVVSSKISHVVRSTMDIFDRFTAKASDPVLESMLQSVPDPFDSYGPAPADDKIFSILPPLSIMSSTPSSSTHTPATGTPVSRPIEGLPATSKENVWADPYPPNSPEWSDATSPTPSSPTPRSTSPPSSLITRHRTHSLPSMSPNVSTHHSRKSDPSKLRSVLSAIDERQSNGDDSKAFDFSERNGSVGGDESRETIRAAKTKPSALFSWSSPFSAYGQSPYKADDAVPGNIAFPTQQSPPDTPSISTSSSLENGRPEVMSVGL